MTTIVHSETAGEARGRPFRMQEAAGVCALGVLLAVAGALSVYALWDEIVVAQVETLATDATGPRGAPLSDAAALPALEGACPIACEPRILDAAAAVRLAAAAAQPADRRRLLLTRASADLARAAAAEPLNGSVAIHRAYALSLTASATAAEVLEAVKRSYEVQPFSKAGGLWRVGIIVHNWGDAGPDLKRLALNEALWLPATGVPADVLSDVFDKAGLGLQLELARRIPPV